MQVDVVIRRFSIMLIVVFAVALSLSMALFSHVDTADAKMRTGEYTYAYGHPELWGIGQGPQSGYVLGCGISKVSGPYVRLRIFQAYFYGDGGFYRADQGSAKTVRFKNGYAAFKFKTFSGDTCRAKMKLISKKKVKLAVETTKSGRERFPITTGYKYKVLKWYRSEIEVP